LKTLAVTDPKRLKKTAKALVQAHLETFRKSALVDLTLTKLQKEAIARAAKRLDDKGKELNKQIGGGLGVPPDHAQKKSAEIEAKYKELERVEKIKDQALLDREVARLQKLSVDELLKEHVTAKNWAELKTNPDKTSSGLAEISKSYQKLSDAVEKDTRLAYEVMAMSPTNSSKMSGLNPLNWIDAKSKDWFDNHKVQIIDGGAGNSVKPQAGLSLKFADRVSATVDQYLDDAKKGKISHWIAQNATKTGILDVEYQMQKQKVDQEWNDFLWEVPRAVTTAVGLTLAVGGTLVSGGTLAPVLVPAMLAAGAIDLGHTIATYNPWQEASLNTAMANLKNNPELQLQTALFVAMMNVPIAKGVNPSSLKNGATALSSKNSSKYVPKILNKLLPANNPGSAKVLQMVEKLRAPIELGQETYFGFLSAQGAAAAAELCSNAPESMECKKALLYAVLDAVTQGKQTHAALTKLKASQAYHAQVAKGAEAPVKDAEGVTKPASLGKKLKDLGNTPITAKAILDPIKNMNAKVKTQLGTLLAKASPAQLQRFKEWSEKFKQKIARKTKTEQEKAWDDAVSSCMGKKSVASIDQDIIEVGGKVIFLSDNASYLPQGGEGI
jgi:hypothetical protein